MESFTKENLMKLATTLNIRGRSAMNKSELIKALRSQRAIQNVFNSTNLRRSIIGKAASITKRNVGITNWNGSIEVPISIGDKLQRWMIPKKKSKANQIEEDAKKMVRDTRLSKKDIEKLQRSMLFDIIESLKIHLHFGIYNDENRNVLYWLREYKNANNVNKANLLWKMLVNQHNYSSGGSNAGYINKMNRYKVLSEEKKKEVFSVIPELINVSNNRNVKLTQFGKIYSKFVAEQDVYSNSNSNSQYSNTL